MQDKYEAESTRLREEMQQSLEKIQDLASILCSHAEDVGAIRPGSPPDVEGDFDELMEARDVMARLRAMSPTKIVHLANYARQRAMVEAESGRAELEAQLSSVCAPRSVRDFRMVRVRDARTGMKEQARTAMLNVWDAKALGDEMKEGRRFLVSSSSRWLKLTTGVEPRSRASGRLGTAQARHRSRSVPPHAQGYAVAGGELDVYECVVCHYVVHCAYACVAVCMCKAWGLAVCAEKRKESVGVEGR